MPGKGVPVDMGKGDWDCARPARGDEDDPATLAAGGCSEVSFIVYAAVTEMGVGAGGGWRKWPSVTKEPGDERPMAQSRATVVERRLFRCRV